MRKYRSPFLRSSFTLLTLVLSFIFLSRCGGGLAGEFHSLLLRHPTLLQVLPEPGSTLTQPLSLTLQFSERLNFTSIGKHSVTVLTGAVDEDLLNHPADLIDAIKEEDLPQVPLIYELEGDEKTLVVSPQGELEKGIYHLVITPQLTTVAGIPFNQKPGEGPYPFRATYGYGEGIQFPSDESGSLPKPPPYGPEPEFLRINEILYDGQASETDGEAFIELYGTPQTDISHYQIVFINGSDGAETDRVTLPRGSLLAETGVFVIADLRTNTRNQTQVENFNYLDNFDPQNGPDAVLLLDRNGKVLDTLGYGEGAVEKSVMGHLLWEGAPARDTAAGHSLSRVEGFDTQNNQIDFLELEVPTPGTL